MPLTVNEGYEALLKRLAPHSTEQQKAKSHKDSVERCMINNFGCYQFPETGSFGNGTGVRHHSDTDYFAVCDAKKLTSNSTYTLGKVREALQNTFHSTDGIGVNTPAVRLQFGQYASEVLEVTPCTFAGLQDTPLGKKASYYIPDYDSGWMLSSPLAHNAYVKSQDDRLGGKLKPLIRLIKAWKYYNEVPILSFYLELRVAKYAEGEKNINYGTAVKRIFEYLENISLANMQDPMEISGYVRPCQTEAKKTAALSKLSTAATRAKKASEFAERNVDEAFRNLDLLYNYNFPAR